MWIKNLFSKPKQKNKQPLKQQQQQQQQQPQSSIFIDTTPDTRYSTLKIATSKSLNLPPQMLHFTESILFHNSKQLTAKSSYSPNWQPITLIFTDRQVIIQPDIMVFTRSKQQKIDRNDALHLFLGMIEKVEYLQPKKQKPKISLTLKDGRMMAIQSVMADLLVEFYKLAQLFVYFCGVNKAYAFKYGKIKEQNNPRGWDIYNHSKQIKRQGLQPFINSHFKIIDNTKGEICHSYPLHLIVPSTMSAQDVVKCSKFRTKQRLPAMTFFYEFDTCKFVSIFRCSQNKPGFLQSRSPEDEKMIECISRTIDHINGVNVNNSEKHNVKIYDARGYVAAWGNKMAGKGFESQQNYSCSLQFLSIPNIHAVRNSYNTLKNHNPLNDDFYECLAGSGWLDYLFLILAGVQSVVKSLRSGVNVVIHCSDGWDRTSQLASLAQLVLDPYYRTIEGFAVLVEKDWRGFGHKFRQRTGQYHPTQYHSKQISPIFIQFLDCTYQIIQQFPLSFEFNSHLLLELVNQTQSLTYGTFLTNNIQQAKELNLEAETVSVWSDIFKNQQRYVNKFYNRSNGKQSNWLNFSCQMKQAVVWKELFLGIGGETKEAYTMSKQIEINKSLNDKILHNQQIIDELQKQLENMEQTEK